MSIGFLNLALLAGLAALAIPPILHFLNRRRHDVVDWGAMQFLLVSPAKRRRFMIEELLLMALRMGLLALLVLGFAAPYAAGPMVAGWNRPPRDTVLILDGSYSMQQTDGSGSSPWQQARAWCDDWLRQTRAGDRVAVLLGTRPPQVVVGELTADLALVRETLDPLPPPTGNADWPRVLADASVLLRDQGQASRRDIIVLSDRQKLAWADPTTLSQWHDLGRRFRTERDDHKDDVRFVAPMVWAVNFGDAKAGPNLRLAPLETTRTVVGVGQRLRFATEFRWDNTPDDRSPSKIKVSIGEEAKVLPAPKRLEGASGRLSLTFEHRFTAVGVHRVTVMIEPDQGQDVLAVDDRQDLVVEVVQDLPVLLIDGDPRVTAESSTSYLVKALADPADKAKASFIVPRVVSHEEFDAESLLFKAAPAPRAAVLADVPRLTELQVAGLTRFVQAGGGVLVVLGPRAEQAFYNDQLHGNGKGLLPARLDRLETVQGDQAIALDVKRFLHPALTLFRDEPNCTLGQARYTRWWKAIADTHGQGTPVALFSNADPWLVEKRLGQGRVIMSTLPMDRSWDGHLPKTWEFPVLVHELLFTLADARGGGFNLQPGQALRVQPPAAAATLAPTPITLYRPDGKATTRSATSWPFVWPNPGQPGAYEVSIGDGPRLPVVVHADSRESDLTPCNDEDRKKVAEAMTLRYLDKPEDLDASAEAGQRMDVWWMFLTAAAVFLCVELWLTRRMALGRGRL